MNKTQSLRLPYERQTLLGGYKTAICLRTFGYLHTGLDIACRDGTYRVHAAGRGIVLASGRDNLFGWGLAILYPDCISHSGDVCTLAARYMHLRDVLVKTGDCVNAGDVIALEGSAGTGERHLHFELDCDISAPCRTPQVGTRHSFWQQGGDTTTDPALWLFPSAGQILPCECDEHWLGFTAGALANFPVDIPSLQGIG